MAQECQYPELLFEELYGPGLGEGGDKHPAARHSDNPVDTIGSCWYWKILLECVCDFFFHVSVSIVGIKSDLEGKQQRKYSPYEVREKTKKTNVK